MGCCAARMDHHRWADGQLSASDPDPQGCRPASAAHLRGRDRRTSRLWHHRPVRRSRGARGELHVVERVDAGAGAAFWSRDMNAPSVGAEATAEPVLGPVDCVSELLFGLFMALTFVGALSATNPGVGQVGEMFIAAFGCNIAWGMVDAVMCLVRTVTDRGRLLTLIRSVQSAADPNAGHQIIEESLSRVARGLLSRAEIEAVRGRILAMTALPDRPRPRRNSARAGAGG